MSTASDRFAAAMDLSPDIADLIETDRDVDIVEATLEAAADAIDSWADHPAHVDDLQQEAAAELAYIIRKLLEP